MQLFFKQSDLSIRFLDGVEDLGIADINVNDVLVHNISVYLETPLLSNQSLWIAFKRDTDNEYPYEYEYSNPVLFGLEYDDFYIINFPREIIKQGGSWQFQLFIRSYDSVSGEMVKQIPSEMRSFTISDGVNVDDDGLEPITNETIHTLYRQAQTIINSVDVASEFVFDITAGQTLIFNIAHFVGLTFVNWGDGSWEYVKTENVTESDTISHTYATAGEYTVKMYGIKEIGDFIDGAYLTFDRAKNLKKAILSNTIKKIKHATFSNSKLQYIEIPNSVNYIARKAFSNCEIEEIILPKITEIGPNTFQDCKKLKNIVIPNTVTKIYNDAFSGCIALTNVVFSKSLEFIGEYAFDNCESLINIELYENIKEIEKRAFDIRWSKPITIKLKSLTPPIIGKYAFGSKIKTNYLTFIVNSSENSEVLNAYKSNESFIANGYADRVKAFPFIDQTVSEEIVDTKIAVATKALSEKVNENSTEITKLKDSIADGAVNEEKVKEIVEDKIEEKELVSASEVDEKIDLTIGDINSILQTINGGRKIENSEIYEGAYSIRPATASQTLETKDKLLTDNLEIEEIPFGEISNLNGGTTITIG